MSHRNKGERGGREGRVSNRRGIVGRGSYRGTAEVGSSEVEAVTATRAEAVGLVCQEAFVEEVTTADFSGAPVAVRSIKD